MAVKFNPKRKKLENPGRYIFEINGVSEVTTKKNKKKIVVKATPYDNKGLEYEPIDIWFNTDAGDREDNFLESVGKPDDLEETIGKRFDAEVTFYDNGNDTYINTNNFSAVEQDAII